MTAMTLGSITLYLLLGAPVPEPEGMPADAASRSRDAVVRLVGDAVTPVEAPRPGCRGGCLPPRKDAVTTAAASTTTRASDCGCPPPPGRQECCRGHQRPAPRPKCEACSGCQQEDCCGRSHRRIGSNPSIGCGCPECANHPSKDEADCPEPCCAKVAQPCDRRAGCGRACGCDCTAEARGDCCSPGRMGCRSASCCAQARCGICCEARCCEPECCSGGVRHSRRAAVACGERAEPCDGCCCPSLCAPCQEPRCDAGNKPCGCKGEPPAQSQPKRGREL